ncbi:5-methyltetrahydropteroyltriglutamate--homocysteine S-methyltransferase [Jiangella rhizosphaerae]|uniref:5-methyltetrahydropteroyltriglutamate--homocysteine methyltransferase n=1 Tax=Jiangella rhizosphaerae TaxID=2293569 RepID=A0A418KGJ3_9ACTN|nr:5-methyltetrahydropteroyltriglutamate--homocysteine S-methyltransferase [Jiangella rhizosphaerae]RIQ11041.1 5-methyltetrahydropteroyltriglutamate--homocysteine S-methyltransferase [Jiangella rhizosphaerae]
MTSTPPIGATVPGYPRIGPGRELKRALESYWSGASGRDELDAAARAERERTWRRLSALGLDSVPSNTFSLYDQVLDAVVLTGAVPPRFASLGLDALGTYFAMARGTGGVAPLELTKWFDTNYHYLVPEIGPATRFHLDATKPVHEYREALALGVETRPVLPGPTSLLLLSKPVDGAPDGFRPIDRLDDLLAVYALLLTTLAAEGVAWVQLDEPAYVADRTPDELDALRRAYERLGGLTERPAILVSSYFGSLGDALPVLASSPVEAIGLDLVAGSLPPEDVPGLAAKTVVAGVVDGRNVWRTDLDAALATLRAVEARAAAVAVGTSCSLLHVPYDLDAEAALDPQLRSWLAFADQKVAEVVTLAAALRGEDRSAAFEEARAALADRAAAPRVVDDGVRARLAGLTPGDARRGPYAERAAAQRERLGLPPLPTTTIGSFPQTGDIRRIRAAFRAGRLDRAEYTARMRAEIERVIRLQEKLGLDVLVHGEPERNDMVQYFAEHLHGFVTTEHGWVQSYGSRCVRPPILYGDVSRPAPITVEWATYAQSLTDRPVKGMLTGPVTILAWSFVRDDQPLGDTARQVALAIRDETVDLEAAGVGIVQVDEPALRELLPLRSRDQAEYLDWSVSAFRLATSGVADATQVHTHLCYSEFGDVVAAIDGLDADVTSIEAARSRMEIVADVAASGFGRGIGPGVYDIHSPRVPGADEVEALLRRALDAIPADRLWVNPDCGLKTRTYEQVEPALAALVEAAWRVR